MGLVGSNILLPICCHKVPPPICCWFVILLKSYTWQHIWSSKSIFKICLKSRFFENLHFETWICFEGSTCAPDARNHPGSNIASLLPIFNKNVVFQQQMLFFHSNLDFYLNECTESWKINICCREQQFCWK